MITYVNRLRVPYSVADFGDSIQNLNVVGNSYDARGIGSWANVYGNRHLAYIGEYAEDGDTTSPTNGHSGMTVRLPTVIAARPSIIRFCAGGNNITNGGVTLAQTKLDFISMFNTCFAAGVLPELWSTLPSTAMNTSQMKADYFNLIRWQREYCQQNGIPFVDLTDIYLRADTFSPPDWITEDGKHPDPLGAQRCGNRVWQTEAQLVPLAYKTSPICLSDTANLHAKQTLSGTGGTNATGGSGELADGLVAQWNGSAGAYTASKITRTDRTNAFTQQIAVTSPGLLEIVRTVNGALYSNGDTILARVKIDANSSDAWSGFIRVSLALVIDDDLGTGRVVGDMETSISQSGAGLDPYSGTQQTPATTLVNPTAVRHMLRIYTTAWGSTTGTGTIRFFDPSVEKQVTL